MSFKIAALGLLASVSVLGGCRTFHGAIGDEAATKPLTKITWAAPLEDLDPPAPGRKRVWVQYRDASGQDIQLRDEIREAVERSGYELVSNPDTADYRLQATLRDFGRNVDTNIFPKQGNEVDDGSILDGFSRKRDYAMIVDVVFAQRYGNVSTTVTSDKSTELKNTAGGRGGQTRTTGETTTNSGQEQVWSGTKGHITFSNNLMAWTVQITMSEAEAIAELKPKVARAIANAITPAT